MQSDPDQEPEIDLCNCWHVNYGSRGKVPGYLVFFDRDDAVREVAGMKTVGGSTIVELTVGGLKPDPEGLVLVSKATGVHIIMGCGHYVEEYQGPANRMRSVDDFAEEMVTQICEGAWNCDVRAGLIGEIGCQAPWTNLERRVMEGALIAQCQTGAALNVHPGRDPDQPQEVADFVRERGADMSRLIISHIDRTVFDEERLLRLADTGYVIELDLFGQEQSFYALNFKVDLPNDAERLRWIRRLIERGYLNQVVISHDICYKTRLTSFGGHGYGHIFENVVPMMRRKGFSEAEINGITVETPRRLLTFA